MQDAHQLVEQAKRRATKNRPKAIGGGIFGRFSNLVKCRPEVAGEVISGVTVSRVVVTKLGDSRLNGGRIIRLCGRGGPVFRTLGQYFAANRKQLMSSCPEHL